MPVTQSTDRPTGDFSAAVAKIQNSVFIYLLFVQLGPEGENPAREIGSEKIN